MNRTLSSMMNEATKEVLRKAHSARKGDYLTYSTWKWKLLESCEGDNTMFEEACKELAKIMNL